MSALSDGIAFASRRPVFPFALLLALCAPTLLGFLPLDRALASLLDLRPAARGLIAGDDGLWIEFTYLVPSLPGTALGSALVALLLAVPAVWIAAAFTSARALALPLASGLIAHRGIGVALVSLPLRALPIVAAALVAIGARDTRTLAAALPYALVAASIYFVGSSVVAVIVDLTRGAAMASAEQPLLAALGAGLITIWRRPGLFLALVLGELSLTAVSIAAVAVTRPLGIYGTMTGAIGVAALVLRAFGSTALIAAAATGAASRSA